MRSTLKTITLLLVLSCFTYSQDAEVNESHDKDQEFEKLKESIFDPKMLESMVIDYTDMVKAHGKDDHALVEIKVLKRHFKDKDTVLDAKQYQDFLFDTLEALYEDMDSEFEQDEEFVKIRKEEHEKQVKQYIDSKADQKTTFSFQDAFNDVFENGLHDYIQENFKFDNSDFGSDQDQDQDEGIEDYDQDMSMEVEHPDDLTSDM